MSFLCEHPTGAVMADRRERRSYAVLVEPKVHPAVPRRTLQGLHE